MSVSVIFALVNVLLCSGLAIGGLLIRPRTPARWAFVAGMFLLSADSMLKALGLHADSPAAKIHWHQLELLAKALIPSVWLVFSLCYSRGNYREFLRRWWPTVAALLIVPALLAVAFRAHLITGIGQESPQSEWVFMLGWSGVALHSVCMVGMILVLMNLERTFRASVGTMRWRIKYTALGLAVIFGGRIYQRSQAVLYTAEDSSTVGISVVSLFVGCLLITISLFRSKLAELDIYPSHAVLHRSLTALLAGAYLLIVGVLAKAAAFWGEDIAFPVVAFLVLMGLVGLSSLLLSERVRQRTRRFVSQHFRRPLYDYRKVWSAFTQETTSVMDEDQFCRAVAKLIAENFEVLSVTIWRADVDEETLTVATSTSPSEAGSGDRARRPAKVGPLIQSLVARPYPVDIDQSSEPWLDVLKEHHPDHFRTGGHRVCVPMVSGGELMGLMTIGDRVSGLPFSSEDFELLKSMGDQVAAGLRNIGLSKKLLQAKEMEAMQMMSAFFIHDLKNTASTLSLMLQNMTAHFQDPAFREDAIRALSKSVAHINDLIAELGLLRQRLELHASVADLNEVVATALAGLEGTPGFRLVRNLQPTPRFVMDPDHVGKVVTNLVMNAKEALGPGGEIRVETNHHDGWVTFAVTDNGPGMDPEFVRRSLFKPFQSTKKKGLGIGLFHCKTIVEAHGGRIEVESERGQGTTFRVWLPLKNPVK